MRKWRLNNADRVAATHLRRQKRTKMTFGFSIDYIADVVVRIRQQPCHYCGGAGGEADHIVPISRGGLNHPQNLVPACRSCNASKGNRLVSEWDGPPAHRLS
jgi:5-methylcytosine-specific restriction endonuclease McrA